MKLADIDQDISEIREEMSLPPPSTQNIISAPPLIPRSHSREQSRERLQKKSDWNCIIV